MNPCRQIIRHSLVVINFTEGEACQHQSILQSTSQDRRHSLRIQVLGYRSRTLANSILAMHLRAMAAEDRHQAKALSLVRLSIADSSRSHSSTTRETASAALRIKARAHPTPANTLLGIATSPAWATKTTSSQTAPRASITLQKSTASKTSFKMPKNSSTISANHAPHPKSTIDSVPNTTSAALT